MAINILQELNLGSAKPSFSRDEVASLADIKNLDVANKYPNNYEIYCREDGCKYRLNKVAHSTMQDNLPHPTGKWRRSDAVISSAMPAPITTGDVILYLGPTVMDPSDQTKIKYQTGKYYRTEWGKTSKQMYAFTQTIESNAPIMVIDDGSGNQSAGSSTEIKVWYSDTLDITTDTVLFTPDGEGALFENREHAIIVKATWDGESAITDYVYGDGSADAKPELTRDSTQDAFFDSYPALVWKLFDTEAEVKEAAANAENALEKATRMDSLSDEMITEIAGAEEQVKEFIYGGNADGFVKVYNREAEFMYEMDLEKQKSCTDIASYFYHSDSFGGFEYTTDAGSTYTLYGFSGPAYYFVPYPTDAIDLNFASAAEESKISYENKIADASQSEEALELLNSLFVTSAVNDNKCLLVSNTILLNKENEEESRTVGAAELDSVLANDVEVTLGTYNCDTFTYDIDEVYVGLAIYVDALKIVHDFLPEQEQDPEFEMMSGMYKLMYDLNDASMTYLRIGVRDLENIDENHIRFTLGDEEYFGGLKDYILSRALEEVQNIFNSIGVTYTEETALEYLGIRLSVITYIHIHRDNDAILDVNALYDSNLSNSLAEHIQVLSGGKTFIDNTNKEIQSLKTSIKNSKSAIDKSISEIKSDMSDMDTKIENADSKIENIDSRFPQKTADYIKNNIVEYTNLTLSSVQNYNSDNFTHFVSLGVQSYNHDDANRTIAPVFINYFDDTKEDYADPSTVLVYHPNNNSKRDTYVGILGYLDSAQNTKQALVDKLHGFVLKYNRDVRYYDKINRYFYIKDVYVKLSGAEIANSIESTGWVRVEPDSDLGEVFENISDILYGYRYAQVIIVVDGYYGDSSFQDIGPFEKDFDNIMQLISFENNILESTLETVGENFSGTDVPVSIMGLNSSYSSANYNGLISIGKVYDHEEKDVNIQPVFKNYFDSSKNDYVTLDEIVAYNDEKTAAYIAVPIAFTPTERAVSKNDLINSIIKDLYGSYDKSKSHTIYVNTTTLFAKLVDVYIGMHSTSNSTPKINEILANNPGYWTKITDNAFSLPEWLKWAAQPQYMSNASVALVLIYNVAYASAPLSDSDTSILGIDTNELINATIKFHRASTVDLSIQQNLSDFVDKNIYDAIEVNKDYNFAPASVRNYYPPDKWTNLVSIGNASYYHEDENRTISPVFKNYFDNSSSRIPVGAEGLFTYHDNLNSYVGILCNLKSGQFDDPSSYFSDLFKEWIARYNPEKRSDLVSVVDIYVRIASGTSGLYGGVDNFDASHVNNNSSTDWVRVEPNSSIGDALKDIVVTNNGPYHCTQIIVVVDGHYDDAKIENIRLIENRIPKVFKELFRIEIPKLGTSSSSADTSAIEQTVDVLSSTVEDLSTSVNAIDGSVSNNTSSINSINSNIKSIIQKYPIKLAYSFANDSGFNGALKINADSYDPETTSSVSLSFYNYYDSSKGNYRNPVNPATPMLVEDKFIAVAAYIDIPEVLGIPSYTSAPQLKEHCKNISVRFDRTKSIKVDLQNNNNTSIYSGANVFIRDIYFKAFSTTQAPILASYTYSTKITNSNPIDELVNASDSTQFIPIFIFILEVIPDANYSVPLKSYLAGQNFAKFINELCEISFNRVRDAEDKVDKAQEAIENMSSVTDSVDNISDSMSDYMSAKWLPTPIAFPSTALENESEPSGNRKNYDFLLYPTFVDTPNSTGSSLEGKNSRYSIIPIPEFKEDTTVKALYESEDSMYLLFGFFGEKLLPESLGGDYTIPETYNEDTIENFNRSSKTLWYSDIYMDMQNPLTYSMIKGIRDSSYEIDISNIFLNFDPQAITSLYAKVTSDPGDELTYSTYTERGLSFMVDFVKIPYANNWDINTISMEDVVNMCGRPDKTQTLSSSKAVILFVAEINKSRFTDLASLTVPAYGISNTTSEILAIYQAMFANNSDSSPIYMARSINDSLKKTKEVAVEAAREAAANNTNGTQFYIDYSDLRENLPNGGSGYILKEDPNDSSKYVADVYIRDIDGSSLIKIVSDAPCETSRQII